MMGTPSSVDVAQASGTRVRRSPKRMAAPAPGVGGGPTLREWIPAAQAVAVVGDVNGWEPHGDGKWWATKDDDTGVWTLELPAGALKHGDHYRLRVQGPGDVWHDRLPAFARYTEPGDAMLDSGAGKRYDGVYWDPPGGARLSARPPRPVRPNSPRVYECHAGMGTPEERVGTWREFADEVLPRAAANGYNAVQLMAVQEHPYYASFGYHVSLPFAPSSRCGPPEDLVYLVDKAHELGLQVLLDVVHSHACKNVEDGVAGLDLGGGGGTSLFHEGERGYHRLWDSRCYDYGSEFVKRYLLSNLRYWMEDYGFDGFRFDGVTSMLYTHHGIHTEFHGYQDYFGTHTDVEACVYLMMANELIKEINPEGISIAEDVSGMPTLCRSVGVGGVGFDYRLAMGVPDLYIDLLENYRDEHWPVSRIVSTLCNRRQLVEKCIAYTESHDQAMVGDKTHAMWLMCPEIYDGMSALEEPSAVIARGMALHKLLRLITIGLGGEGYLTFFGNEFGHPEWIDFPREGNGWTYKHCRRQWHLPDATHLRFHQLGYFDREMLELEERTGFMTTDWLWVSRQHDEQKLVVFERGPNLVFVINFHPHEDYVDLKVGAGQPGRYRVALDSDQPRYGGFGRIPGPEWEKEPPREFPMPWPEGPWDHFTEPAGPGGIDGRDCYLTIPLVPARSAMVLELQTDD